MMKPTKLRKTRITVEAVPLTMDTLDDVRDWIVSQGGACRLWSEPPMRAITGLALIRPDLGEIPVRFGDWVAYDGVVLYAIGRIAQVIDRVCRARARPRP